MPPKKVVEIPKAATGDEALEICHLEARWHVKNTPPRDEMSEVEGVWVYRRRF
jgi:hypothetical protein